MRPLSLIERLRKCLLVSAVCALTLPVAMLSTPAAGQEINFLEGHTAPVYAVAVSPDGKTFVTASFDRTIRVWDATTRESIRTISDSDKITLSLAISPDGRQFAAGGFDEAVRIYDLPFRAPTGLYTGLTGNPTSLVVSPDGKLVVSGDEARIVRLWNGESGAAIRNFAGVTEAITGVSFNADATQVLSTSKDGYLRGWLAADGAASGVVLTAPSSSMTFLKELSQVVLGGTEGAVRRIQWPPVAPVVLPGHGGAVNGVALSPDGKWMISAGLDQKVQMVNLADPKKVHALTGQSGPVTALAVAGDPTYLATSSNTGLVSIWKLEEGETPATHQAGLAGHTGAVNNLALRADGGQIATAGQDGTIRIWDRPEPARAIEAHSKPIQFVLRSPDGKQITTASDDKKLVNWNVADGKPGFEKAELSAPTALAASPDGKLYAMGDLQGQLYLISQQADAEPIAIGAHLGKLTGLAFHPTEPVVYSVGEDGTAKAWNLKPVADATLATTEAAPLGVAVSPDGKQVLLATKDGVLQLLDPQGKVLAKTEPLAQNPTSLASTADLKLVLLGNAKGATALGGDMLTTLFSVGGHAGAVSAVAIHPEQKQFATTGADGLIRLWHLPIEPPQAIAGHEKGVNTLALSPDDTRLATGGADLSVQISNTATGKAIATLETTAATSQLKFSADGKLLAIGSAAGEVTLADGEKGTASGSFLTGRKAVSGLGFDPAGKWLATGGAQGLLKYWQLPLTAPASIALPADAVIQTVSADGNLAAVASAEGVSLLDVPGGKLLRTIPLTSKPTALAFSPDKLTLAVLNAQGTLSFWQTADGAALGTSESGTPGTGTLDFHAEVPQLVTASTDGTVRLWKVPAPEQTVAAFKQAINSLVASPDGKMLAAASDKGISLFSAADGKLIRALAGHTGVVANVAFSTDGTKLVSAAADKTARVWNVADGKELNQFEAPTALTAAVLSSDSKKLAAGASDGKIYLWPLDAPADAENPVEPTLLEGHTDAITALVYVTSLNELISASKDKTLQQWKVDGTNVRKIDTTAPVTALALSPDGTKLASAGADGNVRLWEAASGKSIKAFGEQKAALGPIGFTADNLGVVAGVGEKALLWDLEGELLETFTTPKQAVRGVALLPTSALTPAANVTGFGVVLAGADGSLRLRDRTSSLILKGHVGPVQSVRFAGPTQVLSGGDDKTVRLWNLADGKELRQFAGSTEAVQSVAVTPDFTKVLAASTDKNVRRWNLANATLETTWPHAKAVERVTVSTDGTRMLTSELQGSVQVWDLALGLPMERFEIERGSAGIGFGPTVQTLITSLGKAATKLPVHATSVGQADTAGETAQVSLLAVSAAGQVVTTGVDKKVKLWDATGKPVREYAGLAEVANTVAIDNTAKLLAAGAGKKLHLWNLDNGAAVKTLDIPQVSTALAFIPTEGLLAVASADFVRVYRHADGVLLEELAPGFSVQDMEVAHQGRMLVLAGKEGKVSIDTRRLALVIAGHTGEVTSLAYSPDGAQLVSGGADKTVRIWKTTDGVAVRSIPGHTDVVTDVAFGTAGIVSLSKDKTLRLWNAGNGAVITNSTLPVVASTMKVNPEATRAVLSGADNLVYAWDLASGKMVQRLAGHTATIPAVSATPDMQIILSASNDKTTRLAHVQAQQFVVADAGRVHAVAVLPDGSGWLTAGDDKIVKLWNETDQPVRQFSGSALAPARLVVRPDGLQIAAGGDPLLASKEFVVWNVADAKLLQKTATPGAVTSVAFQPEGNLVAVGSSDTHVYLYEADKPLLWESIASVQPVSQMVFVDPHTLALGGNDGQLRLQDVSIRQVLTGHTGAVLSAAYTPDGKTLATGGADKLIKLWNLETGAPVARNFAGPTTNVTALDISADGKLITASSGPTAFVWNFADGKAVHSLEQGALANRLKFSADSSRLAVAAANNQANVYDVSTGLILERILGHTAGVVSVDFGPEREEGLPLVITGSLDNRALVHRPNCLTVSPLHTGPVTAVAASPDNARLYTVGEDKLVQAIATDSLTAIGSFAGAGGPQRAVALSADGKLLTAGGDDKTLRVWDTATVAATKDVPPDAKEKPPLKPIDPLAQQQVGSGISAVAISSTGEQVVAGGEDFIIRNFHLRANDEGGKILELTQTGQGHTARIGGLALAGDDHTLFSVSDDRTFKRWYNAAAVAQKTFKGHQAQVFQLAYSPDGTLLAGASADKSVRLWNLVRRTEPAPAPAADADAKKDDPKEPEKEPEVAPEDRPAMVTCQGHEGQVFGVSFAPDSKQLASCGLDRVVRVWGIDGQPTKTLTEGIKDGLYCLSYSPDGKSIAAAGLGGVWHQWTLGAEEDKLAFSAIGHSYPIYSLTYNATGTRVATIDYSGNLFTWNNTGGTARHHQQLPTFAGYCVRYLPDGINVLLGTQDSRGMVLTLSPTAR